MSIEIGDGGLGYIYLGDILIAGGGGGESGWKPNANTIAYYPLNTTDTVNDKSGNGHNLSNNGITFGTNFNVDCAKNDGNYRLSGDLGGKISDGNYTLNLWLYKTGGVSDIYAFQFATGSNDASTILQWGSNNKLNFAFWYDDLSSTNTYSTGQWINVCLTFNKSTYLKQIYVNGVLDNSGTANTSYNLGSTTFSLMNGNGSGNVAFYGGMSEVIMENKVWTAQEISNYYNQTKSNYGL